MNRRRARIDIEEFAGYITIPERPLVDDPDTELFAPVESNLGAHHKLILAACIRTVQRPYGRLLMLMPPGAGKTTYGTVVNCSYLMGWRPGVRIGVGSYGSDIARKMGRRIRSIIRQARYKALFGAELLRDSNAADQFILSNGSQFMADSLGGQFPGNRLDVAIADDPIKGRVEANSPVVRDSAWEEFRDNFMSRLVPRGALIVTMTHWHQEDPAGHILPEGWEGDSGMFVGRHDGLDWEVLCLQARCETHTDPLKRRVGEYLHPEWFDSKHWQQFERDASSWNALYQQRPRPLEGAYFTRESFLVPGPVVEGRETHVPVPMPAVTAAVFAVIDTGIKTGKGHDGTGVVYYGLIPEDVPGYRLAILDYDYVQIQGGALEFWLPSVFARVEELAREANALMGSYGVHIEDKGSGIVLIQRAENKAWDVHAIDSGLTAMGKAERAFNAAPYVSAGDVKITEHAYHKTVTFKDSTKNHFLTQVLNFAMDSKDNSADDLLDCLTYGVAIGIGGQGGF